MLRNVSRIVKSLSRNSLIDRLTPRKMDVTRHNFKELLPDIEEAIQSSSFMCIDGEFTGLNAYRGISPFDLPEHRYDKLQESARQFLLVQFGLCTFHHNPESGSYTHQAYNFYVWPRPCSRQAPDPRFLCQTSSLDFLISQNFDFNKLFRDGISYLRPMEVEKLRSMTMERQEYKRALNSQNNTPEQIIAIPQEQEPFINEITEKLKSFLESKEEKIEIDRCNSFQRRLIYQTARQNFTSLSLSGVTRPGGERVISVSKDASAADKLVSEQEQTELNEVEEAFGFAKVIKMISESKKLVVGHNMVLDVCHTLNQFCAPLPQDYAGFKEMTSSVLPNILDTKLMANTIPFKDEIMNSSLNELLRTVSEKPYEMLKIKERKAGYGYSETDEKYHEAGYDAYVTGLCLISMHKRLCKLCGQRVTGVHADSLVLKPFLNKLYLMKVADIPYMNLGAEDMYPDRDHVFHLEIPSDWKTHDLVYLFSNYGSVNVFWINDTSVFVALREKTFSNTVLQTIQSNNIFKISTYREFAEKIDAEKATWNSPENGEGPGVEVDGSPAVAGSKTPARSPFQVDNRKLHTAAARGAAATRTASPAAAVKAAGINLDSSKAAAAASAANQTGITPMLEKTFEDGIVQANAGKAPKRNAESVKDEGKKTKKDKKKESAEKRPGSPDSKATGVKRSKSIVEDKTFEEPAWD